MVRATKKWVPTSNSPIATHDQKQTTARRSRGDRRSTRLRIDPAELNPNMASAMAVKMWLGPTVKLIVRIVVISNERREKATRKVPA